MTTIPVTTSAILNGSTATASSLLTPIADLKAGLEGIADGTYPFVKAVFDSATLLTISAGAVTVTQTRHRIQNEGGATSDDLTTLSGVVDILLLQQGASGQTTTLKHNVGNIYFDDGRDLVISDQNRVVALYYNSTTGKYSSGARNMGSLWLTAAVSTTLSSDTLTATQSKLKIVPESGTADNLSTVSNPNALDMLVLSVATAGHTITVKHNVGNIFLPNGLDYVMDSTDVLLVLLPNPTTGKWTGITAFSPAEMPFTDPFGTTGTFTQLELPPFTYENAGGGLVRLNTLPRFGQRRQHWDEVQTGTTFATFGMTMTNTGTASASVTADTRYIRFTSGTTAGDKAGRASDAIFQYRWSPVLEAKGLWATNAADSSDAPIWFGLMSATQPTVASGGAISYTGVSGVWIKAFYVAGLASFKGQAFLNGSELGYVQFGVITPYDALKKFAIYIDAATNNIVFEVGSERSSVLNITPSTLTSTNLALTMLRGTPSAAAVTVDVAAMYGSQN